jgi:hypothetical protein
VIELVTDLENHSAGTHELTTEDLRIFAEARRARETRRPEARKSGHGDHRAANQFRVAVAQDRPMQAHHGPLGQRVLLSHQQQREVVGLLTGTEQASRLRFVNLDLPVPGLLA